MINFYNDPTGNPLGTPSGKLEFYSDRLAQYFPDDKERGPYPRYVVGGPKSEGWTHDESLEGERCQTYPLLMQSNHPRWRHHVQCDDVPWLREIPTCKIKGPDGYMYEPVWLNPATAAAKGVEDKDLVKIFNERGTELGAAYITERVIPGVVYMDHGSRMDPITTGLNRGGTVNPITPENQESKNCWGMAVSGFLVDIEKLDPAEMAEWRKQYPAAFARDYEPAYGLLRTAWVEGGSD
jgi:trimethylamine-N-oxide reductase (cytochrome c)